MATSDNAVAVATPKVVATPIPMGKGGVQLSSLEDAFRFARYVISSGLAPQSIKTPEQALICMQTGAELGFSPMRSLAWVTVVNGRAGLMGEAALAKIRESKVCDVPPVVSIRGDGDARVGVCRFKRRDMPDAIETTFSVAEAKKARLWGKQGPWTDYPDGQLQWRAVGRAWKLYFSDLNMGGIVVAEELHDYAAPSGAPAMRDVTPPAEPDPLLIEAAPTQAHEPEIDPDTGEVIPEWVGRDE